MHFGVTIFPTDQTMQPVELGRAVEDLGFESLWFPEHSHIPVDRRTPWGGVKDAPPLPDQYWRTHDQFVAFGAIASVTSTLKLGTGITLVAQRDPIWLAKQVATLDQISNGRVLFGIGYGWNKEEMAQHGTAYLERRAILRENILAMKALWTQDEASFSGEHVQLEPSWAWPKPAQQPHPPIILGGAAGPKTIADIVEFCDGWMPIGTRHDLVGGVQDLRAAAVEAGRDPDSIEIGVFGAPKDPAVLEQLAAAGVARAVFTMPAADPAVVLEKLQDRAKLVASLEG
jgi:probable F420-dependent oxidoreductase